MSSSDDFWQDRVLNPNALGQAEKDLWKQIEPILSDLLDELKANGKIETSFVAIEKKHLGSLVNNLNQISISYNLLLRLYDNLDKFQRFLEANAEFGFDESKSVNLYVEVGVLLCILSTELFKALLLFHLKDVDYRVSNFSREMGNVAPITWQKLKPYVDSPFRNSLAHGTWGIENEKVVLFKNAKLEIDEELELADFMKKLKNQNVLYACLASVIADKKRANFFT